MKYFVYASGNGFVLDQLTPVCLLDATLNFRDETGPALKHSMDRVLNKLLGILPAR
jgi:hypothetical protein